MEYRCFNLRASATKNGRPADQPISCALAADLSPWLSGMPPGSIVFPLHHETAKAMKADLERAGIAYENEDGVADFHSLRACFISAFVRSGASIATVRDLARHAKAETTLKHYAKSELMDQRRCPAATIRPRASIVHEAGSGTTSSLPAYDKIGSVDEGVGEKSATKLTEV